MQKEGGRMKKALRYGFITCTLAYLLIAIVLLVLFGTLFRGSYEGIVDIRGMVSALTLMLSEFPWWGGFYYFAFLVPWLTSCSVLTLLIYFFNGGARKRALFTGFSMLTYYFAVWLVFMVNALVYGWGDIAYNVIWVWPLCGFVFGYAAATIVQTALKA